jgi:hypothetical protein
VLQPMNIEVKVVRELELGGFVTDEIAGSDRTVIAQWILQRGDRAVGRASCCTQSICGP